MRIFLDVLGNFPDHFGKISVKRSHGFAQVIHTAAELSRCPSNSPIRSIPVTAEMNKSRAPSQTRAVAVVLVFASFLAFSAIRGPVPGVNEPHFLTKAKHYWDPDFCAGDFFLNSANTHLVFYQTVGLFTRVLTLEQTAWAGRIVALMLLAVGWTALVSRLVEGRWSAVWGVWVFLALAAIGNFSGEWIVGGVEAKVFTYAFVLLSLAMLCDRSWNRAAIAAGLAIAFHPVVGIWSLLCGVLATSANLIRNARHTATANRPTSVSRTAMLPVVLLLLCSLPGLFPALRLIGTAPATTQFQADSIQVFYRLKHHLDPMDFTASPFLGYGLLLLFWGVGSLCITHGWAASLFRWFVLVSVLIALAGLLVGAGPRPAAEMSYYALRMKLMKFYPFRLSDVMLPMACAVVLVELLSKLTDRKDRAPALWAGWRGKPIGWMLFGAAMVFALAAPAPDRNPSRMSPERLGQWKAICRWVQAQTPPDAQLLTPRGSWAFKWYAQRAEYVSNKDCPQDAAGIVEWYRRLRDRNRWNQKILENSPHNELLRRLHEETGLTHLVVRSTVSFETEPIYRNRYYAIYRLTDASAKP